jgi:hypothetical protein
MQLPIAVEAQDGVERNCVTRDVSDGGIFFFFDGNITPGSPIEVTMMLPPEITGGEEHLACCCGRVVRVEADSPDGQRGVAVKVGGLVFLPEMTA